MSHQGQENEQTTRVPSRGERETNARADLANAREMVEIAKAHPNSSRSKELRDTARRIRNRGRDALRWLRASN